MDDEQKTPEQDETPQDEAPQDEAPEAAGPVSDSGLPLAGESSESSPPAAGAAEEEPSEEGGVEEPSEEGGVEEPSEGGSGEPSEGAEDPVAEEVSAPEGDQEVVEEQTEEAPPEPAAKTEAKGEKKKDVIPGADLEPILVEPEGPALSAEERARLEAEEEEKARREAELAAAEEADPATASRAPAKMEKGARFLATGKRKRSIARVTVLPGNGKIEVNKRSLEEFFPRPLHQTMVKQPLAVSGYEGNVDVRVRVHGGGISGQAGAVRHGIARALTEIDAELRGDLKRRGFLTRDARVKERRKAGLKKARKRPQFSKR
jgi:small subunit ribosomal protein S9